MSYGYPEVYGRTSEGFCGHCGGRKEHAVISEYGVFCLACFRWDSYDGPKQQWGDSMQVTQHRVIVYPAEKN